MKRKLLTSVMIFLVAFTMSFTSVFADALSQPEDQPQANTPTTETPATENETETGTETENPADTQAPTSDNSVTQPESTGKTTTEEKNQAEEKTAAVVPQYSELSFDTTKIGLIARLYSGNKDNSRTLTWGMNIPYVAQLTPVDGAPAPGQSSYKFQLSNNYKTPIVQKPLNFGNIKFTEPGTYKYNVSMNFEPKKRNQFAIYDTAQRTIEIIVEEKNPKGTKDLSDNEEKELTATAKVTSGKSVFTNRYEDIDRPYSFMIKPAGINTVKTHLPGGFKHATVYQCESRSTATGMYVVWYTVKGAKGYLIYKKTGKNGKWKYRAKVDGYMHISYRDKSVKNGVYYEYKVIAKTRGSGKKPSIKSNDNTGIMGNYFLRKPVVTDHGSWVSWQTNARTDGMRIEVCKNNVFTGARAYMVPKGTNSFKIPEYANKAGGYRFVRVMPYKFYDGRYHYGLPWLNKMTYRHFDTKVTFIVKDEFFGKESKHQNKNDVKEMLSMAGQKMWGWDTTQGITYDGRYAYMNVENRYANSIKVIKMDTTQNFKVVKVSKPVRGCHGNDITYNSDTRKLYITYSYFNKRYVARMNPKTMKYEGRNHIKVPYKVAGPHGHRAIDNLNCYNEISYDNVKKQYLLKKKESHSMVVLDKNFKVIRYMRIHERVEITNQNMQASPEFFYRVQSNYQSNKKNNYVTVFDWHGTYITHFNLIFDNVLGKAELENIFFIGDQMYGACYKKWWDTKKVGSTVKLDKVKRHGKWVFKTKKVTKANQKKLKQLRRTSYIFKINLFG